MTLYEMPEFEDTIQRIRETKIIKAVGVIEGTAAIHKVTCDIAEAIEESEVIIIIVPTMFQLGYARLLAPIFGMDIT